MGPGYVSPAGTPGANVYGYNNYQQRYPYNNRQNMYVNAQQQRLLQERMALVQAADYREQTTPGLFRPDVGRYTTPPDQRSFGDLAGSIGRSSWNFVKGSTFGFAHSLWKGATQDENGNFSLWQTAKSVGIAVGVGALMVATAGTAVPLIIGAGAAAMAVPKFAGSAWDVGKNYFTGNWEAAEERAFHMGEHTTEMLTAFAGTTAALKGMKAASAGTNYGLFAPFRHPIQYTKDVFNGIKKGSMDGSWGKGVWEAKIKNPIAKTFGDAKATSAQKAADAAEEAAKLKADAATKAQADEALAATQAKDAAAARFNDAKANLDALKNDPKATKGKLDAAQRKYDEALKEHNPAQYEKMMKKRELEQANQKAVKKDDVATQLQNNLKAAEAEVAKLKGQLDDISNSRARYEELKAQSARQRVKDGTADEFKALEAKMKQEADLYQQYIDQQVQLKSLQRKLPGAQRAAEKAKADAKAIAKEVNPRRTKPLTKDELKQLNDEIKALNLRQREINRKLAVAKAEAAGKPSGSVQAKLVKQYENDLNGINGALEKANARLEAGKPVPTQVDSPPPPPPEASAAQPGRVAQLTQKLPTINEAQHAGAGAWAVGRQQVGQGWNYLRGNNPEVSRVQMLPIADYIKDESEMTTNPFAPKNVNNSSSGVYYTPGQNPFAGYPPQPNAMYQQNQYNTGGSGLMTPAIGAM